MNEDRRELDALTSRRWRIAVALTVAMIAIYFGFMMLVAYAKQWLAEEIVPGLSWGILIGASVIVAAWLLTVIYIVWANRVYDPHVERFRKSEGSANR